MKTQMKRHEFYVQYFYGKRTTDLPQSDLGRFAALVLKTRTQKIRSVNFVPPLIKPWDYEPEVVRRAGADSIAASGLSGIATAII